MVRNLLIWISGVAFVLAGAVAAVAITSTGSATAQTADDTTTAVRTADPKSDAADTFAGVADDVLDRLVAADVITEDDADGARTYLDEARTKF
ncbi:MAG: hypothetical protein KDB69_08995, partial [Acidimicrobiia bacterium]|nr:hypothetical protein [Acidimicrobiia bacterium]